MSTRKRLSRRARHRPAGRIRRRKIPGRGGRDEWAYSTPVPDIVFANAGLLALAALGAAAGFFAHRAGRAAPPSLLRRTIRSLALALAGFAAAGPAIARPPKGVAWIAVVDASRSMDVSPGEAAARARTLLAPNRLGQMDLCGAILFGREVSVEREPAPGPLPPPEATPSISPDATNLEEALRAAAARLESLPPGIERAILLWTDGRQTLGDWRIAVPIFARAGIRVFPVLSPAPFDLSIESIEGPPRAAPGVPVELAARVRTTSPEPVRGSVRLFRDRAPEPVAEAQNVEFLPGAPLAVRLADPSGPRPGSGFANYRAEISSSQSIGGDRFPENDAASIRIPVEGEAVFLDASGKDPSPLGRILGARLRHVPKPEPSDLSSAAVLLDDPDPSSLSPDFLRALAEYVRRGDGGLFFLGGARAATRPGFQGTPLEDILPVWLDPDRGRRRELLFLLDATESMRETRSGRPAKSDLARDALLQIAKAWVRPDDRIAIQPFRIGDSAPPARPLSPVAPDLSDLRRYLSDPAFQPRGRTDFLPLLDGAAIAERLAGTGEALRHAFLLTDGGNNAWPADTEIDAKGRRLGESLAKSRIRFTAILVESGAVDEQKLRRLVEAAAASSGGAAEFKVLDAPEEIAKAIDLSLDKGSTPPMSETPFRPAPSPGGNPWGARLAGLPDLSGSQRVSGRAEGTAHASDPDGRPVLATRTVGLGRTAFFASSPRSLGRPWIESTEGAALLADLLRAIALPRTLRWSVRLDADGPRVLVTAEGPKPGEGSVASVEAALDLGEPDARTLRLLPVSPGRFESVLEGAPPGRAGVLSIDGERHAVSTPSDAEFRRLGPDGPVLREIAARTGGAVRSPADALPERASKARSRVLLSAPFAAAAAALVLLESLLAIRRRPAR